MELRSEKVFYERKVIDICRSKYLDVILWGEDLFDARMVVYPKKIKDVPGYNDFRYRLTDAGLVYFNFRVSKYTNVMVVRWDPLKRAMYITEGHFNKVWKFLRNSIALGIKIRGDQEDFPIKTAEDIVDLSLMRNDRSNGVIEENVIKHIQRELSEEEKRAIGRKQSALDNKSLFFFYSDQGESFHDRECVEIKKMQPEYFKCSETMPDGYMPCRRCKRRLALRWACDPFTKQIGAVDHILKSKEVKDSLVFKYAFDYGLKFSVDGEGNLNITSTEDDWIIKGFDEENLSLWHNNYVRTGPESRYITTGFHNQGLDGKSIFFMMEYIKNYSFVKHLESEEFGGIEERDEDIGSGIVG